MDNKNEILTIKNQEDYCNNKVLRSFLGQPHIQDRYVSPDIPIFFSLINIVTNIINEVPLLHE
jgi:predicted Mrr-cat superfamily restriction endonuclease